MEAAPLVEDDGPFGVGAAVDALGVGAAEERPGEGAGAEVELSDCVAKKLEMLLFAGK